MNARSWLPAVAALLAIVASTSRDALAWEPVEGQFQGWARGGTLTVFVDPIPSDAPPYTDQAVAAAIRTYGDAMVPFCGPQLVRSGEPPVAPGIVIRWSPTPPAGRWTDVADVDEQPGLRQILVTYRMSLRWRGVQRLLTHAMGHALGLGHSQLSDGVLLRRMASLTDLNSADPVAGPGADELAGLKSLWGSCSMDTAPTLGSRVDWMVGGRPDVGLPGGRTVSGRPSLYRFTYAFAHDDPRASPQTELSFALPGRLAPEDIEVRPQPEGWTWMLYPEDTAALPPGYREVDGLAPAAGVLQFRPPGQSGGLPRDGTPITFTVDSLLGPLPSRAFSNSTGRDSIDVPANVPGDRDHPAPSPTASATARPSRTPSAGATPSGTTSPPAPTGTPLPAVPAHDDAIWIDTADGRIVRIDDMSHAPWETVVVTRTQGLYGDIGFAPDGSLYGVGLQTDRLMRIDLPSGEETDCGALPAPGTNALSFDHLWNAYVGSGTTSRTWRRNLATPGAAFAYWWDFATGASTGDFVFLKGRVYVAWLTGLLEVTVDPITNEYRGHRYLHELPPDTYGLASDGESVLYAVTRDGHIFSIVPPSSALTLVHTYAHGEVYGASSIGEPWGNVKTPTFTPTPSPTSTPTASATATASSTPTATATSTAVPSPCFLPLALRETCDPVHERSDIALVLDTSSSMAGAKIADARAAALLFVSMIDLAPGRSQVAVVRYDREAEVVQGLTNGRPAIEAAVRRLQVRSGTFIDKGLRLALAELDGPRHVERNHRVLLLLTDGVHTGTPGDDRAAAAAVRSAGVRLYTIGLGGDVDGPALEEMAGDPRRYFFAPESYDLARIYGEVARDLMCPGKRLWGQR